MRIHSSLQAYYSNEHFPAQPQVCLTATLLALDNFIKICYLYLIVFNFQIEMLDFFGRRVERLGYTSSWIVSVDIAEGPLGSELNGTLSVPFVGGLASFYGTWYWRVQLYDHSFAVVSRGLQCSSKCKSNKFQTPFNCDVSRCFMRDDVTIA